MQPVSKPMHRIAFFLFIFIITSSVVQAQPFPDSWQPGMVLTTGEGGGMRGQSDSVRISDKISFEKHIGPDNNKHYAFTFSQKELNDLLRLLKEKHFDKIKTKQPAPVYDGWSGDMVLQWKAGTIIIETGAGRSVPEAYRKDLAAISRYIVFMVEQKKKHCRQVLF